MNTPKDVLNVYRDFLDEGINPKEAAVLTLAYATEPFRLTDTATDNLAHAICIGIRKGLFGAGSSDHDSLPGAPAMELSDIASAINNLADAVRNK